MALIALLATCVINLLLGLFVFVNDPRANYARSFFLICISICVWAVANYFTDNYFGDLSVNILANKATYISGYCVLLSGLIFTYFFPISRKLSKIEVYVLAAISIFVLCFSSTNLISGEVAVDVKNHLTFSTGSLLWVYLLSDVLLVVLIAKNLLSFSKLDKNKKIQSRFLLFAFCAGAAIAILLNIVVPLLVDNWHTTQFGSISTVVFVACIVYAITRYGLFDIRLAVVRALTYVLSLLTLSVVYYCLAYFVSIILFKGNISLSVSISPINIVLALLLAFIFQPVKQFFDRVTNRYFYKDNYNSEEFFSKLNRTLTSTTDLRGLLERVANDIAMTLKGEQAFFYIHTLDGHFITAGTDHHTKIPRGEALELQIVHEMNYGLFIASLRDENDPIRRLMVSYDVELILPLKKGNIVGYLCVGNHMTSHYTSRDIKVLNTIADELVIAIQNALAIQEIRELNTNLQQKINNATRELRNSNMMLRKLDKIKDEFVGIASHQLRTPLTSVKGYISMILDGDAGSITNTQRELLSEAYISSERMVHLINDFLNVSRLQTGKFIIDKKPTDLSKVVGEEIDSLRTSAASRNMEFVYRSPKTFPILDLDEGKMRQVIMNFADNSIYYSNEGTKIKIDLSVEGKDILFTVKDTGIGVPKSEQAQLFTKFYRASNARSRRPDGTGVGLFLAKKVIDAHHGQVVFESVEGKGSTFGFRLPIAENKPAIRESDE